MTRITSGGVLASTLILALTTTTHADIYQWTASRGIYQSTTLTPDGAGKTAEPYADLQGLNLYKAYLREADLTQANLSNANLADAYLYNATLTNTDLSDAIITEANFGSTTDFGFTATQLYSTASYKNKNLAGIKLYSNDLTGWNLAGQNLASASFYNATLTNTDLSDAIITEANFGSTTDSGFTAAQLYSTASYKNKNLAGIDLRYNDLTGWNLAGQNLTDADFDDANLTNTDLNNADLTDANLDYANLTNTDLSDAIITEANFGSTTDSGFTAGQLYSTASYKNKNLAGIDLRYNDLTAWNLAGQNLTDAYFGLANLANTDLSDALITGADFYRTTDSGFTAAQLYSTASYKNKNLTGIDLGYNDLTGWNLAGQNLTNTDLNNANLTDAYLYNATLTNTDLSDAIITEANFGSTTDSGFTATQLYSTASYKNKNLTGIKLYSNDLTGWNLAGQNLTDTDLDYANLTNTDLNNANLTDANLDYANLTNTDLSDALITGADFYRTTDSGFTAGQLYSTASYKNKNLAGIDLGYNDLTDWDLSNLNLQSVVFNHANLHNTDFTASDLRRSHYYIDRTSGNRMSQRLAGVRNAIHPDGRVKGLILQSSETLRIWDDNPLDESEPAIPITIEQELTIDPAATLRLVFEDNQWGSIIQFADPDTPVALAGTLLLEFDDGLDLQSLQITTYQLFDWTNADITGAFDTILYNGPGTFDTSSLMATGEVTYFSATLLPADANLDGSVDMNDLSILAANFGLPGVFGFTQGDFNGDNTVDLLDLSILASHFGNTAIPEPAAVTILLTLLPLSRRRSA
ncbi:pentapeptide repeat-containing protein [Mucisphaera calidilacus]|uniref:Secreted effector protein pipB2 n=1 Tax=Mucisphaera calidilacus TaxID=2527982 RepID=A0A518C038_9BACT|nr:pentapeptide repeat-containing protein [Mucisphaera calidilacus]QDU72588.1 Secreted effector protein pipB2 [Mucisphaera calidilacus]